VTHVYCDETAEARITHYSLKNIKMSQILAW